MKQVPLGRGGLRVSAVGLGCMGMSHGYGAPADREEMRRLLACAVDHGCTHFDTAEIYGTPDSPHHNEELLGRLLAPYRSRVVVATKFGLRFDHPEAGGPRPLVPCATPAAIRRAVEGSLRRLRTDCIDLCYQHRIDPAVSPEEVADTMALLIREGKVRHWGISETTEDYLRRAHRVCPVAAVQCRYSLLARGHERLFPVLEELGVGFVAFSPLANGLLSACHSAADRFDPLTDYRASMPQFRPESFAQNAPLFSLLADLADAHHATPAQVSLAWMLCRRPWIAAIPGTRRICRMKENLGAADVELTPDELAEVDRALGAMRLSEVFGGSPVRERKQA